MDQDGGTAQVIAPSDEGRFEALATGLQVGVLVQGRASEMLFCNEKALDLLGLTRDQLLGRTTFDARWNVIHDDGSPFPPETHPVVVALATGKPVRDVVMGVFRPDRGDRAWILVSADSVLDAAGRVQQAVVTFTDIGALKRAEEAKELALRDVRLFRQALDDVPAFVYIKDRESRYVYGNTPTLQLFGVSADELNGSGDARFFPPETVTRLREIDVRVLAGERMQEKIEVLAPDGTRTTYLEVKSPLQPNHPGEPVPGLLGISIDISERERVAAEAERTGAFYAALAQSYEAIARGTSEAELFAEICRVAVTVGGVRMAWVGMVDPAAGRMRVAASYGDTERYLDGVEVTLDPADPRSHGPTGIAVREGRPFWIEDFARDPRTLPWRERATRSGWVSSGAVPLFRRGRAVGALTMYAVDTQTFAPQVRRLLTDLAGGISMALDRFAAEDERRVHEARLRLEGAALASAADAIVISDRQGVIESVNAAFTAMTGYTEPECIGRTFRELLRSGKQDRAFYTHLWDTILQGNMWRGELVNRRKDGRLYTEESTITPVRDDRGAITHFVAVKRDVTERRALEEQFRQAQRMESVGRLAGGVAHDFNNMLSVILGRAELALMQVEPGSPVHEDLVEVIAAGKRSADLTRQLLAFARRQSVSPRSLDVNAELASSLKLLRRLISEDIVLHAVPAAEVWPVYMDPSQLDQVLANLCVNARDSIGVARADAAHDAAADMVTIATANRSIDAGFCAAHPEGTPGDYVMLSVRDTGCGMPPEVQSRIFEPFFTTKAPGEGTGLGLATVFGAVKQNGGFIVVSSAPGQGATFDVYLPRQVSPAPARAAAAEVAPVGGRETILVVEDESLVLQLATQTLRRLGYTVLEAGSPESALRVAAAHRGAIDLLLTDVIMPGMNGRQLAGRLLRERPTLKLLYMSGHTADILSEEDQAGASAPLLRKPFTLATLAARVRAAIGEA